MFDLVPVVDLKSGQIVHAVGGNREGYQPITKSLYKTDSVTDFCRDIQKAFQPNHFYLADLDCIEGDGDHFDLVEKLLGLPVHWMLDFGIRNSGDFVKISSRLNSHSNWSAILASESISDLEEIRRIVDRFDNERLIFSFDFKNGLMLGHPGLLQASVQTINETLDQLGINNRIFLELSNVGRTRESALQSVERMELHLSPEKTFLGGGFSTLDEVERCQKLGFRGVLSASAFHNGILSPQAARNLCRK